MVHVFLFHRDLRLHDHRPLQECLSKPTLPVFVLDPRQVSSSQKVKIMSKKSVACLFQSLQELDQELWDRFQTRLIIQYGEYHKVLSFLHKKYSISHVYETKDYTPFAIHRESEIRKWCQEHGAGFTPMDDLYFFPPGTIRNKSGKVFQKFTPFYNTARQKPVPKPLGLVRGSFVKQTVSPLPLLQKVFRGLGASFPIWTKETLFHRGGRKEGMRLLQELGKNYKTTTLFRSGLSVHHHYGTISVRESYAASHRIPSSFREEFQRQLYWREFYANVMTFFKELYGHDPLDFQKPSPMSTSKDKLYRKWCEGTTGEKVVDAAMNQLRVEGFMPNRLRLICASWLVKDAGVPWRYGERYFANHLLDYDLTQNMLNWLWVAGGLPFAMAPFRRFNAILPSTKEADAYLQKYALLK